MPAETKLEEYNLCAVPWSRRETAIAGKQRGIQGFCKCYIDGVIGGEIAVELPNPGKQKGVAVTIYGQVRKILNHLDSSRIIDLPGQPVSTNDLGDFHIQEMRRMPALFGNHDSLANRLSAVGPQQELNYRRCI